MKFYKAYHPFLLALSVIFTSAIYAQPITVTLKQNADGYYLERQGEPYYIRGAGGSVFLDEVVEAGGNSIRTWAADEAGKVLDEAHKLGLTVMFGLWVGHERHGFDYDNEEAVKKQYKRFEAIVEKYKDHPAILLWGIGNEVDLFYSNTKVWDAIQDIAKMIHEKDPHHPTTTVTAGLDPEEVKLIKAKCPDIDIYSVNTYGEIDLVSKNIKKWGWDGPFIIAEWGPTGHWEVPKTKWGVPLEQTSQEKFEVYYQRYQENIEAYKSHCLGSYAFLWGQKQETTSTWYGIFTEDGKKTATYDAIEKAWRGKITGLPAPRIDSATIDNKHANQSIYLSAGSSYPVEVYVGDAEKQGKLDFIWEVRPESDDIKSGGDAEEAPEPLFNLVKKEKGKTAMLKAPKNEGAYRLFIRVENSDDKVGYANIPFYVVPAELGDGKPVKFIKQQITPTYN